MSRWPWRRRCSVPPAMPLVALAVAVMVPAANVMSVAALARHGRAGRTGPLAFARAVATNPLIVACVAGIAINLSGLGLPALAAESLTILGRATLALGLLTVGAGLRPAMVADRPLLILATTAAHLLLRPAVGVTLALLLGLGGTALAGRGAGLRGADRDLLLHPGPAARRRRRTDGRPGDHDHSGRAADPARWCWRSAERWAEAAYGRRPRGLRIGRSARITVPSRASTPLTRIMLAYGRRSWVAKIATQARASS